MKLWQRAITFAGYIALVGFLIMLLLTNADVIARNVFGSPINLVLELTGFSFAFSTFLVLAMVVSKRRDLTVEFLIDRLSAKAKLFLRGIYDVMGIATFAIIFWATFAKFRWSIEVGDFIPSDPRLPTFIPWLALALGLAMLVISLIVDLFETVKSFAATGNNA